MTVCDSPQKVLFVRIKRLLCVDDDTDTLRLRKRLLEAGGYSVLTVNTGDDALQVLGEDQTIDLVLLDYLMPGMNGDELARKIRSRYPVLPLVSVSAVGQLPESLLQVIDARVQKGQDPELLLSTIAGVLARTEMTESGEPKTVLCVEDEDVELKMRRILFESAGYRVLQAKSSTVALEIFTASHVDAVVMDYWLSGYGGNGTALAESMKRLRPKVPIVMLSGYASLPGEGAVVDSWVRKGEIEPENLVHEVERLIELRNPR
jgi:CheY-like chemotaxis protein